LKKKIRKNDILFFYSETNKNFEKLRGWTPNEFSMRIWKKSGLNSKINFKKNNKKNFSKTILLVVRRQSVTIR